MNKQQILQEIHAARVVAVVRADSGDDAIAAARALVAGGVRAIEITFTVPDAAATIAKIANDPQLSDSLLLGAGTVTTVEQARAAIAAGAQFLVSPVALADVIAVAREHDVAMLPGALTPTEVFQAYQMGGDIIKIFPAARMGPDYLKDLRAPFPQIPLMPTGGVDAGNARQWLDAGAVALGAGGKLVDAAAMRSGQWDVLTERARELMAALQEAPAT